MFPKGVIGVEGEGGGVEFWVVGWGEGKGGGRMVKGGEEMVGKVDLRVVKVFVVPLWLSLYLILCLRKGFCLSPPLQ